MFLKKKSLVVLLVELRFFFPVHFLLWFGSWLDAGNGSCRVVSYFLTHFVYCVRWISYFYSFFCLGVFFFTLSLPNFVMVFIVLLVVYCVLLAM